MSKGTGILHAAALLILFVAAALADDPTKINGRIVGEKCAQLGKIGECYLKWAEPLVFFTDEGEYYLIDLARSGITRERFDEAFGQEVEVHGQVSAEQRIQISQLNILRPPTAKEFFKG